MKQINKKIWAFAILSVLVFTACDKANETTVDETSQGYCSIVCSGGG